MKKYIHLLLLCPFFIFTACENQPTTDHYKSGLEKYEAKNYQEAIADFDKAIAENDKNHEAYIKRGNAKAEMGNYKEALPDFDKAVQIKPDFATAYYNRGLAYYQL